MRRCTVTLIRLRSNTPHKSSVHRRVLRTRRMGTDRPPPAYVHCRGHLTGKNHRDSTLWCRRCQQFIVSFFGTPKASKHRTRRHIKVSNEGVLHPGVSWPTCRCARNAWHTQVSTSVPPAGHKNHVVRRRHRRPPDALGFASSHFCCAEQDVQPIRSRCCNEKATEHK